MQRLVVNIASASDSDDALLEHLTRQLRQEIEDLDVGDVELPPVGPPPRGAKGDSSFMWGKLLITLAGSGSVLVNVVKSIQSWIQVQGARSVTVEIDGDRLVLTGVSSEDQTALIQHWIERHQG